MKPDQKSVTVGKKSMDALLAEFRSAAKNYDTPLCEPEGPGWVTASALKNTLKVGQVKFYEVIRAMMEAGKAEAFNGSQRTAVGRVCPQRWYRLK